jgi:hypothetical protein
MNEEQTLILADQKDNLQISTTSTLTMHEPLVVGLLLRKWRAGIADHPFRLLTVNTMFRDVRQVPIGPTER